jgi:hypothetical protein
MKPLTNGNGRIEALREREKAIRAAISAESEKLQKREAKEQRRLAEIIGGALIEASIPPDLKSDISRILTVAPLEDRSKRLLLKRGWL